MSPKIKCPKCGEIDKVAVEITATWSTVNVKKTELFCNTCGQVSIISSTDSGIYDSGESLNPKT